VLRDARALDGREPSGVCVDTTGLGVGEVLDRVAEVTVGWSDGDATSRGAAPDASQAVRAFQPPRQASQPPQRAPWAPQAPRVPMTHTSAAGEILFVCGPAAVGKSVVAWSVYAGSRRLGRHTAFADLDQIGFMHPAAPADPRNHRLKAANLAALWRNFHTRGARRLVVNGPLDRPQDLRWYADALPNARITVCRLHAAPERLAARIGQRAVGAGPARGLAGDALLGLTGAALRAAVDRSVAEAADLERAGLGDLRVDADARTP
jgi:hypothetical protein